jgi:hypothetical protein
MQRPSAALNDSKGFGLDLTRTTLNYRPSSNFRESAKADDGSKQKSKFDLLFNSIDLTEGRDTKSNFRPSTDPWATQQPASFHHRRECNRSVPRIYTPAQETMSTQSKMLELKKTLLVPMKTANTITREPGHKRFLSFFVEKNFAPVDYSLLPKDQILNRLFAQVDFSLVHLTSFLSEKLPNRFYKLHQVCALFNEDLKADRSVRQLVVTKEMVLHQFIPESKILRLKLLNKSRLDNLKLPEFTLKTRSLISEVLRQSFNK